MGPLTRNAVFAVLLVLSASGAAFGDALCNYGDTTQSEGNLKKGRASEKEGKTLDALLFFRAADTICGNRKEAREGIRRIGSKMGREAAAKGRIFTGKNIFSTVPDADCRRWVRAYDVPNPYEPSVPGLCIRQSGGVRVQLDPAAGAYDWYEVTYNYRESDLLMLKGVTASPGDIAVYEAAQRHFQARLRLQDNGYAPDPQQMKELQKIASTNAASFLAREEEEFQNSKDTERSLTRLENAMKWAIYGSEADRGRVIHRAFDRAEEALKGNGLSNLYDALEYYSFAGEADKVADVAERADELGLAALNDNDPVAALKYFMLSGNRELIDKARPLAEKARKDPAWKKTGVPAM